MRQKNTFEFSGPNVTIFGKIKTSSSFSTKFKSEHKNDFEKFFLNINLEFSSNLVQI